MFEPLWFLHGQIPNDIKSPAPRRQAQFGMSTELEIIYPILEYTSTDTVVSNQAAGRSDGVRRTAHTKGAGQKFDGA